ncbi:MAG TPA: HDOD domain-containing protein [Rhodocyclaceae bacterium]|nr:HDOD domain-containing protein [Rhodocyclaceae bacterium]
MTDVSFPLVLLTPIADTNRRWVGIHVTGPGARDLAALQQLFGEWGLAQAIAGLVCVLPEAVVGELAALLGDACVLQSEPLDDGVVVLAATQPAPCGPGSTVLLKLLGQLTSDADTRQIENTLKKDPQLSVQLLRLVNSVAFAPTARIGSLAQAINLLGRRQLQRWLQLLMFANKKSAGQNNPLLAQAALRAALMENLSKTTPTEGVSQDEAFMVGMFSLLDKLFGQPLETILAPLLLTDQVSSAVLHHSGRLGGLLALTEAAETGADSVAAALAALNIDAVDWAKAQIAALQWALKVSEDA